MSELNKRFFALMGGVSTGRIDLVTAGVPNPAVSYAFTTFGTYHSYSLESGYIDFYSSDLSTVAEQNIEFSGLVTGTNVKLHIDFEVYEATVVPGGVLQSEDTRVKIYSRIGASINLVHETPQAATVSRATSIFNVPNYSDKVEYKNKNGQKDIYCYPDYRTRSKLYNMYLTFDL